MKIAGTNFHRRSIAAAHAEIDRLQNQFEAARVVSPERPYVYGYVQDDRFDATQSDRTEMSRKIRDGLSNLWIVGAIRREFVKWTVGPNGLQVIPETSDDKWDEAMLEDYLAWAESPCVDSTISMSQVHRQLAGEFSVEGGMFWHETFRRVKSGPSEPAIELIRGHSVGTPSVNPNQDIIDGVQLGVDLESGRKTKPVGYWIKSDDAPSGWLFRGADVMHHVYDPEVPGRLREITPYHAVIDTLADLKQLEAFEMQRAKSNAEDAKVFTTETGELPKAAQTLRDAYSGRTDTTDANNVDLERRVKDVYRRIIGARSIALKRGESVEFPTNSNPSAAQQWLWRYKLGQVCAANGVPLILVFPEIIESMQGTVVRGIYDNSHEYFRSMTFILALHARRMFVMYADWARKNRRHLLKHPADWFKCRIIPPRAVNVDIGHNAEARLLQLDAGLTDYDTEAAAHGTTSEVIARRKARQIAMFRKIAEEESTRSGQIVKPEEIAGNLADIREKLANAVAKGRAPSPQATE